MIILMRRGATELEIANVTTYLAQHGARIQRMRGDARLALGVADTAPISCSVLETMHGVQQILKTTVPYPLASRQANPAGTVVSMGDVTIGGKALVVIAGSGCVNSEAQAFATAAAVRRRGASILRGTVMPQESVREDSLRWLRCAATTHGLKLLLEVVDGSELDLISLHADMYEVGARNMQNFTLLRKLGRTDRPILLRRGANATIEEWLLCAEYLLAGGNACVVLCESGIRTFEDHLSSTLDLSAIPVVKTLSHLPVVVDPGHATRRRECIAPLAKASVAAGADGVMIDVQRDGDGADRGLSAVPTAEFDRLASELEAIAATVGRHWTLSPEPDGCAAVPDSALSLGN